MQRRGTKSFQMEQLSPGFSERYLLEPRRFHSELTEYRKYIKAMVEIAGAGNMSANYANEILDFSTKIAKVSCRRAFVKSVPLCDFDFSP